MQRVDALAVARVADDKSMRIKLVAQVESGAGQTYKPYPDPYPYATPTPTPPYPYP